MDKLQIAAEDGNFNLFKRIESEMEEKDVNWSECYGSAFLGGNLDIVKHCEEKGAEPYSNFELNKLEADSTLEGWKAFMLRAAEEGDLNMLMYCELMIGEKYQCILGIKNYKMEVRGRYVYIQRDDDDFHENEFGWQDDYQNPLYPLPRVRFDNNFSTIIGYNFVDLIVRGKEENEAKMIEFLRKVSKEANYGDIWNYLESNLLNR
uniref:Ankyrin repeat protein n=1 Tax=Pithovirus LCPAC403 TaxID=2506596 RepID=A0A481ZDJ7_9VIRU|nr:MAG: uncharacterized protein LCPAC403_03540 [Pithovirus LCPAC403]